MIDSIDRKAFMLGLSDVVDEKILLTTNTQKQREDTCASKVIGS